MPNKVLNSRLKLKVDTLENWESSEVILLAGEVAFATIATASENITDVPTVVMKVGDGTHKWSELKYVYAQASDVYAWAKKAQPDYNDLINKPSIPTVPVYTLESGTTAGTLKLLKNGAGSEVKVAGWDALNTLVNEKADAEHTHTSEDITDFDTAVNALIAAGNFAVKGQIVDADISASAAISQSKIAGLTTALAGKAALEHDHVVADITDFDTAVDGKISMHNGSGTAHSDIRSAVQAAQTAADGAQDAAEAAQATADAAMPKAGGTFTGAVTFNAGVTVQAPTAEMNPATKQYVDNVVSAAASGSFEVVENYEALPPTGEPGVIYLVPHTHGEGDSYDEYIYVNKAYEKIGSTDIDLSNYVNAVTGTANAGVVTNITKSGNTITVASESLATADPTASGNTAVAIDTISQAANGKITATKKNIQIAHTAVTDFDDSVNALIGAATIEGDQVEGAVAQATEAVNYASTGGIAMKFGEVESAIAGKENTGVAAGLIAALDKADSAVTNQYVTAVSEADGIISVTRKQIQYSEIAGTPTEKTTTFAADTGLKVTGQDGGTVKYAIDEAVTFVFDCGTATTNVDSIE